MSMKLIFSSKKISSSGSSALKILFGNLIYACGVHFFLGPGELITGGTTGLAFFLNRRLSAPIPEFLFVVNTFLFLLGWLVLGKRFALKTVLSTFSYPLMLKVLEGLTGGEALTDDPVLNTFFAGLLIGCGLGIVIYEGASTGGMDIPTIILSKYTGIPLSASVFAFDIVIILSQAFSGTPEKLLYGIVLLFAYTFVMDKILFAGRSSMEIKIISDHAEEINEVINKQLDRGSTFLKARGGYLKNDKEIVLLVVSNREAHTVEKIILSIDPDCFMVISKVAQVSGRGFTKEKNYIDSLLKPQPYVRDL